MKIIDGHFHIIDTQFPLVENSGFLPNEFTCDSYLKQADELKIVGGAIVSGSFQAFDQTYLVSALKKMGPSYVGVTQLPASTSNEEILRLNELGIRAVRFNLKRGGSERIEHLEKFSNRIHHIAGWHTELYVDSKDLLELQPIIENLPSVSIDHLGLSKEGFSTLIRLVEKGIKVKATGFGRVDFDVVKALQDIILVDPTSLIFGTDLPSTRAPKAFSKEDIELITDTFDPAICHKIFYENAAAFYRLD
ncbi:amidohydrolase family protein [Puniceicoccaceae bacterium K14]|nr:amidohydrolase family protein [Puniceicoccaceae bacterium K14]